MSMDDVQGRHDAREIPINRVGIKDLSHPITVQNRDGSKSSSIAVFSMSVSLQHDQKGTHMSRFVQMLNETETVISAKYFHKMINDMVQRLGAESGYIEMQFPYFIEKTAPVSGVKSLMDYQVSLVGQIEDGHLDSTLEVTVPVKSLCPCSKEISEYGAHNQRSHLTVGVNCSSRIWLNELIQIIEAQASAELFAILKRPDEKYITEQAYNNPKFVEDVVRDVAHELDNNDKISRYYVHAENFESIHNHSAFAVIEHVKTA
ncbi:MAG: GTP cyclohydrolase I FolE2 [Gammaproteobacteria bacterium]|nr:GTP cyclohydrolase I FolE2 [Gammaproteobacteria bacterium]